MIAPTVSVAQRPHRVSLANPGPLVPDLDGGHTVSLVPLDPPALSVSIETPTGGDERVSPGVVTSSITRLLTAPWHPQVNTSTVISYNGRTFYVRGVVDRDERHIEMFVTCEEQLGVG
jgi:hypothetical protein